MRPKGIIRVTAVSLGVILLHMAAGCTRLDGPAQGSVLSFHAEATLLQDDATKAEGTLQTAFQTGSSFKVFGRRDTEHDGHNLLFNAGAGTVVTKNSNGHWDYTPAEHWNWTGTESDHYEFVGICPVVNPVNGVDLDAHVLPDYPGNIAVTTSYNIEAGDNYDLMAAAFYRDGSEETEKEKVVPMTFYHMTSAVDVQIVNNSHAKEVRIHSIGFKYITVSGQAFVTTTSSNQPVRAWNDIERSLDPAGVAWTTLDADLSRGGLVTKGWNLMIPQQLDQEPILVDPQLNPSDFLPRLCVSYTPYVGETLNPANRIDAEIVLKDVPRANGGAPITSWEQGVKYVYYISMRLDGGLLVELVTTPWDYVPAHTWGLLI